MKATFTLRENIPFVPPSFTCDVPTPALSGIAGLIVDGALKGKTVNATVTATYEDPNVVKFDVQVTDDIPFVPKNALTVDRAEQLPDFVYAGLKAILPDGLQIAGTLTFEA